jgi:hypothetical protein
MKRFACLLLPLLCACSMHESPFGLMADRTSDWYETGPVRKPREEIARTIRELLLRQGYVTTEFEGGSERIETGWDAHLSPRWREGYRTKVDAEILPAGPGAWNVRVRSSMELNDNVVHPSSAEQATWVGAGISDKHKPDIPGPAIKLHTLLKNRFFGLNP